MSKSLNDIYDALKERLAEFSDIITYIQETRDPFGKLIILRIYFYDKAFWIFDGMRVENIAYIGSEDTSMVHCIDMIMLSIGRTFPRIRIISMMAPSKMLGKAICLENH